MLNANFYVVQHIFSMFNLFNKHKKHLKSPD